MRDDATLANFAKNLIKLLGERDISYRDMEKFTGINRSSIHEYASGERAVPLHRAHRIARYFNKTLDEMVENELGENDVPDHRA